MGIQLKTTLPGPRSLALMAERQKHVPRGVSHVTPLFIAKAEGPWLEDVDGNRLLDFACGIGVTNVGQTAPAVVQAIQAQASRHLHAGINVTPYEGYVRLAERLNQVTPGTHAKKTFFVNTGAEAVENAIKIARAYTRRTAVVCFEHAFHGRTYLAMSLTSKVKPYKEGFGPFVPDVYRAHHPNPYRWPGEGKSVAQVAHECFQAFQEMVLTQIGASQCAAVILEPVLGEGGFTPTPVEFLTRLQAFCQEHGIVLIADEIQTGFGRTGTLFASEQLQWVPDLLCSAKGLGGGLPIAAVTGRAEIMDAPQVGGVGGTFGGNPVSCAAALAVLDLFEDGRLLAQARALGEQLSKRLLAWKARFPVVGDVRGLGPMQAMELVVDRTTKEPHTTAAQTIVRKAYERGLVVMTAGPFGNSIRFLFPLTLRPSELDEGLNLLEEILASL